MLPPTMLAARLHGPADLRIERIAAPAAPAAGTALVRVACVGICGSDLHTFRHARIGDTTLGGPLILGHEFAGIVEAVGEGAVDGFHRPLRPGTRVAVDPAQPCGQCEWCQRGDPNLCAHLRFCGLWPDDGALCQWITMPGRCCFPVPASFDDATAVLLEPLGVAVHAVDLAKTRIGQTVAILGAGPIGLCILQVVRQAGAKAIYVSDRFPWRVDLARRLGATLAVQATPENPRAAVETVAAQTGGRGVDVAFEAAWCDDSVDEATEMLALGGKLIVAGISDDDRLSVRHSTARRKGLSILLVRRMKHAYPRAIDLVAAGRVDLGSLVSHRFPLADAAEAFRVAADYADRSVKVLVDLPEGPLLTPRRDG